MSVGHMTRLAKYAGCLSNLTKPELGTPLCAMAAWKRPADSGERTWSSTLPEPADSPEMVT